MLKYRISTIFPEPRIDVVEIIRETDEVMYLKAEKTKYNPKGETKERKFTKWYETYDTWEEAHHALEMKAYERETACESALALAIQIQARIAAMVKPR